MAVAIEDGTATAGMVAKLMACRAALTNGVAVARIVDGHGFASARHLDDLDGTTLVPVSTPATVDAR
jgi:acetylglutamate kinase